MAKKTTTTNPVDPKQAPSPITQNTTLSLTIPWSEVAPAYQTAISKASKNLKIDGFRKGHVPSKIAQDYLDPEALAEETARRVVPKHLPQLIEDAKIDLVAQPEIQIKSANQEEAWQFAIILAPKPHVEVKDYQKIVTRAKKDGQKKWQESQKALKTEKKQAQQEKDFLLQTIYTQLVLEFKPQIPELLVRQNAREELETLVRRLQQIKMTLDDYLEQTKQSFEDLSGQLTARVLGQLQLAFILQAIAKHAKIDVTEAEIDHEIDIWSDKEVTTNRTNSRMRNSIRDALLQNKIIDHLLSVK